MKRRDETPENRDRESVAAGVADRLRNRGIDVTDDEQPEHLADLLSAVERFEAAVEARGGDLMMDDLKSSEPDDPHFVVPRREANEEISSYVRRIDHATTRLAHHPRRPD